MAQGAYFPHSDDFPEAPALGMVQEDEGLEEQHPGPAAGVDHPPALRRGEAQGLFAEDVLARARGLDGHSACSELGREM